MRKFRTILALSLLAATPAQASEEAPARPISPSLTGSTGILRVHSARVGIPGYWDIGGRGMYFQQKPFIDEDAQGGGDFNEYTGAIGAISWAASRYLEAYASSQIRTNFNSSKDDLDPNVPNLDNASGSLIAGAKVSLPMDPLWVALLLGTRSPPNVDEIQFRPDTFGAELMAIATLDLTERKLPVRAHVNAGYILDRSGVLRAPAESPARTFALSLSDYNYIAYGFGVEVPLKYATPFFELSGQQVAGISTTCEDCEDPLPVADAAKGSPRFATIGVRVTPVDGLALDIAFDKGLTSERPVAGVPAVPDSQMIFGASYAFASREQHRSFLRESGEISDAAKAQIEAANAEVRRLKQILSKQKSTIESERLRAETAEETMKDKQTEMQASMKSLEAKLRALSGFRGLVLDADSFAPVGDAVVAFPDTNLSRILADTTSGFFRSYTFPPGNISVAVTKAGYETLLQSVNVTGNADEVVRFLLKKEGGGVANNTPGVLKGRIVDEAGKPVAGTLLFPDAPFKTKEVATTGAFQIKIPPGLYQVDVKAQGYLLQGKRVSVGPNEKVDLDFQMRKRPLDPRVISNGDKLTLKDVINFAFNKDVIQKDSYAILDEVADVILSNPEYSLIRIEGHTDDVGGDAYNLSLSDRRAKAVVNYLLNKGIPPERMQAVGWGKAKPVAPGSDDAARAINRRVEFNIIQDT